jgi:cell division septation protein DedD
MFFLTFNYFVLVLLSSSRANQVVQQYNTAILATCSAHRLPVIDVFGQLVSLLELSGAPTNDKNGASRASPTYNPDSYMKVARRQHWSHFVRGKSWDAISASFGSRLFTDNVHLNSHAGQVIYSAIRGDLTGQSHSAPVSSASVVSSTSATPSARPTTNDVVPQSPTPVTESTAAVSAPPTPSTPAPPPMSRLLCKRFLSFLPFPLPK